MQNVYPSSMQSFSLHVPWDRAFRGRTRQWTKCAINVNGERNSSDLLADPKRSDTSLLSASAAAGCRVACIRARTPWRTRNSSAESGTHTCLERKLCSTSSDSPSYGRDRRSVISVDYTIYNRQKNKLLVALWYKIQNVYFEMDIKKNFGNVCW